MPNGYWGRILRVNLSSGQISVDEPDEKFYRTYLGGRGVIAQYLLKEVPVEADPLGPDNILVFAGGVLSGQTLPGSARTSVGAKSPLTGGYGDGEAGGHWGPKLSWAGYDGLVVTGQSDKPVYLWINDQTCELRDASHLWGLSTAETQDALQTELGDPKLTAAMIGPGGENLVRFACLALGCHDFVGRAGMGAVMGSKKLKAVAVNGQKRPEAAERDGIKAIAQWMAGHFRTVSALYAETGTAGLVLPLNAASGLPTRNFRDGDFEGAEDICGKTMAESMVVNRWGCYACPVRCKRVVEIEDAEYKVGRQYSGPEYEALASLGSNCGISDLKAVAKANEMCNQYSLDTISTGMMISGAMECADKNLLPPSLLKHLDLEFGSAQGLIGLIKQIVNREGLGDILADGPMGVAEKIGPEAAKCFLHIKGQLLPLHEPRWKTGMGLGYVLSPTGADHMHNIHDPVYANESAPPFAAVRHMGIQDAVGALELGPAKARLWTYMTLLRSLNNCIPLCFFTPYSLDQIVDLVRAATGWNVSSWELIKASERALNLARAFNAREGFTEAADHLPERFFEPIHGGALDGEALNRDVWIDTRNMVYEMLGWEVKTARPKAAKLYELGLDWVVDMIEI